MGMFKCCHPCVPPKRHPGCHGHCPEYAAEKAVNDRRKEEEGKKRKAQIDIYNQRAEHVTKALKRHGRK